MTAVALYNPKLIDAPGSLVDLDMPGPELRPLDLLVRVEAVSVDHADEELSSAGPPAGTARILGFDAVSIVEAIGPAVTLFKPGDAGFYAETIDRPGSNAKLHAVDERVVALKSATITHAVGAALPLTSLTSREPLFDRLGVTYDRKNYSDAIRIFNAAGGVGSNPIQMARRSEGLTFPATASRRKTEACCYEMGAHQVIDYHALLHEGIRRIGFPQMCYVGRLKATKKQPGSIAACLAPHGAMGLIDDPEVLDIVPLKRKCISEHWDLMFTPTIYNTPDLIQQHRILSEISSPIDGGVLRRSAREDFGSTTAACSPTAAPEQVIPMSEAHRHSVIAAQWPITSLRPLRSALSA